MQFCELRIKVNTLEFLVYLKGHYAKLAMTNNVEDIVVFTGLTLNRLGGGRLAPPL